MSHIHINHLVLISFLVLQAVIIFWKWSFVKEALSENGSPSSKRVGGFILIETIVICEVFYTMKQGKFELYHLMVQCGMVALCWGIATSAQIIDAWKGKPTEPKKEDQS